MIFTIYNLYSNLIQLLTIKCPRDKEPKTIDESDNVKHLLQFWLTVVCSVVGTVLIIRPEARWRCCLASCPQFRPSHWTGRAPAASPAPSSRPPPPHLPSDNSSAVGQQGEKTHLSNSENKSFNRCLKSILNEVNCCLCGSDFISQNLARLLPVP